MGERLLHEAFYKIESFEEINPTVRLGRISLGVVDADPQPVVNDDQTLTCFVIGDIFDAMSLRGELSMKGRRFATDSSAEIVVRGYESEGTSFFRRLNGSFNVALWDSRRAKLVLANDRFGSKPLYYSLRDEVLTFASSISALLVDESISRNLNFMGYAQFFTFGHLLNCDTFYESVQLLPPGACLSYSPRENRLQVDRHCEFVEFASPRPQKNAEFLDRFAIAFQNAVDRRLTGPGKLGLSLSGGLDSRTILAAIDTEARPVTCVSLGMPGSIDVRAADQMAKLKGCENRSITLDQEFLRRFEQHLERMIRLTDGHYLCQCIVMPTLPVYRELGIDVLLRGHAGELLHMSKAYNYSIDKDALSLATEEHLIDWLYRRLRSYMVESVGKPLFRGRLDEQVRSLAFESLRESVRTSRHIENIPHRIWYHFVEHRLRRETALSMVEFGSVVEPRLPYLDNDLIDLVFNTPPSLKTGEGIQAYILGRIDHRFLEIPNANTGTRVGASWARRKLSRLRLDVLAKLGTSGFQPYERLGLWLRRELRPLVEELLLSEQCFDRGLFDPVGLRTIVREHTNGEKNHTYLILALMIVERSQRGLVESISAEVS